MTFEYTDPDGETLVVQPHQRKRNGQQVVELYPVSMGPQAAVHVPLDRVEEVVAGIRDAARTAAGRPARPLTHAAAADAAAWAIAHEKAAARQTTGQADTDLPARLRAVLTERYTELGNPFSEMRTQFQGPDGWPATKPVGADLVAETLRELLAAPAVGQPAEAQDTDRAALRERLRLAIAQQYLDDTASGRTVDELDDTEFGSLADAALRALTVEDER